MFASLPQQDKLKILEFSGVEDLQKFQGIAEEGECAAVASLPEDAKRPALLKWQALQGDGPGRLDESDQEQDVPSTRFWAVVLVGQVDLGVPDVVQSLASVYRPDLAKADIACRCGINSSKH